MVKGTSGVALLSTLSTDVGTLTPAFDRDVYEYTLYLQNRYDEVSFTLTTTNNSSFEVNGISLINPYAISVGSQNIEIEVISPNESVTKTYTITVERARQFVYVSNVNTGSPSDTLSLYSINPTTGQLEPLTTASVAVGDDPYDLLVSPDGQNLYVGNAGDDTVAQFFINSRSGALSALIPSQVSQGPTPYAMAMTADSNFLYSANGDSSAPGLISQYFTTSTGALSPLTSPTMSTSDRPWFLTVTPNSQFLYATIYDPAPANDTVAMFSINPVTGQLTALSPATVATEDEPWHINVDPSGTHVYLTNYGSASVSAYEINPSTGQLSELAGSPYTVGASPVGLTIDPTGRFVYVANSGANTVSMFSRNSTTGELTAISGGTIAVANAPYGLETDHDGRFLYVANSTSTTVSQFSIDQNTGELTALSPATVSAGTNPRFIRIAH